MLFSLSLSPHSPFSEISSLLCVQVISVSSFLGPRMEWKTIQFQAWLQIPHLPHSLEPLLTRSTVSRILRISDVCAAEGPCSPLAGTGQL